MRALARRFGRLPGVGAWELHFCARRFPQASGQLGECFVDLPAHKAMVTLDLARLNPERRALCRADMIHELLHLLDEPLRQLLDEVADHVHSVRVRRRYKRHLADRYETWHDRMAGVLGSLL